VGSILSLPTHGTRVSQRSAESRVISPGCAPPPPQKCFAPPLAPSQNSFCTPSNYTYFDLIFSYLVILITKFVKLLILWSQMPPCMPRKQVLLIIFLGLSGRCHQAPAKASSSTPPQIFIHPPDMYPPHPPRYLSTPPRKYENPSMSRCPGFLPQRS
jgi:hypothetical protein